MLAFSLEQHVALRGPRANDPASPCPHRGHVGIGILQLVVEPLHQDVVLRVVGCGGYVLHAQGLAKAPPHATSKLPAPTSGDGFADAILFQPCSHKGISTRLGRDVPKRDVAYGLLVGQSNIVRR